MVASSCVLAMSALRLLSSWDWHGILRAHPGPWDGDDSFKPSLLGRSFDYKHAWIGPVVQSLILLTFACSLWSLHCTCRAYQGRKLGRSRKPATQALFICLSKPRLVHRIMWTQSLFSTRSEPIRSHFVRGACATSLFALNHGIVVVALFRICRCSPSLEPCCSTFIIL